MLAAEASAPCEAVGLRGAVPLQPRRAGVVDSIRSWLGLDRGGRSDPHETAALRDLVDALERMDPSRARYVAAFAYLLGRVAHVDQHVSPAETATMERLVADEGGLDGGQAALVVRLAQQSNQLFGGTANYLVARAFAEVSDHAGRLALLRCLFAVSSAEGAISAAEEGEIHRIAGELRVEHRDLVTMRVAHRQHLPGLSPQNG